MLAVSGVRGKDDGNGGSVIGNVVAGEMPQVARVPQHEYRRANPDCDQDEPDGPPAYGPVSAANQAAKPHQKSDRKEKDKETVRGGEGGAKLGHEAYDDPWVRK
jgi:hypothetical protein